MFVFFEYLFKKKKFTKQKVCQLGKHIPTKEKKDKIERKVKNYPNDSTNVISIKRNYNDIKISLK